MDDASRKQHLIENWEDEVPTDEDCMEYGRMLCSIMRQRHFQFKGKAPMLARLMEKALIPLPCDSVESNLGGYAWLSTRLDQVNQEWDDMREDGETPLFTQGFNVVVKKY